MQQHSDYVEVETIRDPECEGIAAVVSMRVSKGTFKFKLVKEFERGGKTTNTVYLERRHVDSTHKILDRVARRIDELEDQERARRRARGGRPG